MAMHRPDSFFKRHYAWFLLASVVLVWGSNWSVMKIGLQFIDPLWFTVLRLLIALVLSMAMLAVMGKLRTPHKADMPIVIGIGTMQFAGFVLLISLGLEQVAAGRAAVLAYTTPLWVAPLAAFVLHERLSRLKLLGVVVGLSGLLVLFNPLAFDWSDTRVVIGNGYLLLAALVWAISIVHVRHHQWRASVLELLPWQLLIALMALLPFLWVFETRGTEWNATLTWVMLYNGVFATIYAQWASVRMTQLLPAITVSVGLLMVPVAGLLLATLWLREPFTFTLGLGMGLIVLGLCLQIQRGRG